MTRPKLREPVLIEGLPGMGFVANIAACHLIRELHAEKFAEITSPSFRDLVVATKEGLARSPTVELYAARAKRDLIILYGNVQPLTSYGQYSLCTAVLDLVEDLGCRMVICMGGIRGERVHEPKVYCAATDFDTLSLLLRQGASTVRGHIVGAAGVLLGLAGLRGMRALCLLAETPGHRPDPLAAEAVLKMICSVLEIEVDLRRLSAAAEEIEYLSAC